MKEIKIRFKTIEEIHNTELSNGEYSVFEVSIDDKVIENIKRFSINLDITNGFHENTYTIEKLMDFPTDGSR